jgi:hypothetical protein
MTVVPSRRVLDDGRRRGLLGVWGSSASASSTACAVASSRRLRGVGHVVSRAAATGTGLRKGRDGWVVPAGFSRMSGLLLQAGVARVQTCEQSVCKFHSARSFILFTSKGLYADGKLETPSIDGTIA